MPSTKPAPIGHAVPMPADLPEPIVNDNAKLVLAKRYLAKDGQGETIEDFRQFFWRVASTVAAEEAKYGKFDYAVEDYARKFYDLMTGYRFLPNSPTLMNAGRDLGQLAACFVLPVEDSIEAIFDAVKHAALIHKSGGGTGFSFSRLRPKEARVGSTGGVASGPVSFMKIFNTATEQIKQGGTRRGANMGILRIDHPDILEFIGCKAREGELNNFNISVGLTEAFMQAVEAGEEFDLVDPATHVKTGSLSAPEVFSLLVQKAWESGDPGIVFLDRINRDNPTPKLGEIESTNPCGEQPLLPYEACNLGSINLAPFFDPTKDAKIDFDALATTVNLAVRFLDNVIDASRYPIDKITDTVRANRKIGLGIMGWADLLFQMELAYDSDEALDLAEEVMGFIQMESKNASRELAEERGPFPSYAASIFATDEEKSGGPFRNATTTTIAPTGTLSIIAGCSSGVEPLFALSFCRHVMDGEKLLEVNPYFEVAMRKAEAWSKPLAEQIAEQGTAAHIELVPDNLKRIFVTSHDISPDAHLRMQAAFQRFTDNAVSKTVNLPNEATTKDIRSVYQMAYDLGCKGVTVYRDGCKAAQVLNTGKAKEGAPDEVSATAHVMERPDVIYGFTQKVMTGLGELYLTVNEVNGKPFEVFATIGKSGYSVTAKAEAIGRLVSLALRSGVPVRDVVNQLEGIGGENPVFRKKGMIRSIPDAVSWVLRNRYLQDEHRGNPHADNSLNKPTCPDCNGPLVFEEGCHMCKECGFSKCG